VPYAQPSAQPPTRLVQCIHWVPGGLAVRTEARPVPATERERAALEECSYLVGPPAQPSEPWLAVNQEGEIIGEFPSEEAARERYGARKVNGGAA
jgi:hypothetical protein